MGGRRKSVIALLVVLALIYWEQSSALKPAYARDGETIYYFRNGDGRTEGELPESKEWLRMGRVFVREGRNGLDVWMEDENGKPEEEYVPQKEFRIDTTASVIRIRMFSCHQGKQKKEKK